MIDMPKALASAQVIALAAGLNIEQPAYGGAEQD